MARGLVAPLSPNEERALRRVGAGITMMNFLPSREVGRLKHLDLVELKGNRVLLTRTGRERMATMDLAADFAPPEPFDGKPVL